MIKTSSADSVTVVWNVISKVEKEDEEIRGLEKDGIIGQELVKKRLEFYISAHKAGISIPTLLFTGSHGLGKTYFAEKIASSLNRRFVVGNAEAFDSVDSFVKIFLLEKVSGDTPVTVLIDEAHMLKKDVTTFLLSLLNPNDKNVNEVSYGPITFRCDLSKVNFIFATTDAHEMFNPLRNRCESVYFDIYSKQEIIDILQFYLPKIDFTCDLEDLALSCRGRARDTYLIAKNIERYSLVNKCFQIDNNRWIELKEIFGIKPMGLNKIELDILKFISSHGPISCVNLAMAFFVNENNVKSELEVRLRELGFITNTTKGRIVTENGKEYLTEYLN